MTLFADNGSTECPTAQPDGKKISCVSQVLSEKYSYTWKLNDFNRIPFMGKYPIFSPNFTLGKRSDSLWQVVMTKHMCSLKDKKSDSEDEESLGEGEDDENILLRADSEVKLSESDSAKSGEQQSKKSAEKVRRLGLRLIKVDETSTWEVVKYYFSVQISNGIKHSTEVREEAGASEYEGKSIYTYITEEDFKDTDFFQESNLIVTCHITFKYIEGSPFEAPEVCEGKNCADDLRLLYNSKKFSDVILMVEGAEIAAHKSILCARAYAFEGILHDYKDDTKQKLDLKVDEEVGRALAGFIYCGGIKENFPVEKCLELYEASQTYGVSNLKKLCSKYFKNHLDADVCRKCLDIDEHTEDCLEVVRKLGSKKLKEILSKQSTCCHMTKEDQKMSS